jgi:hypothetical protein
MTATVEGIAPARSTVQVYCLAARAAEEARAAGCDDFAKSIEVALDGFIATLPRADKREALMLSFQMAMAAAGEPARPHLKLVYSKG